MKTRLFATAIIVLFFSVPALSQQKTDTLIKKLDSLSAKTDSAGKQINNTDRAAYNEDTKITGSVYFILLGSDLKQEFTKPFHMTGKDWGKLGIFAAGTGALMLVDEPLQKSALDLRNHNPGLRHVSSYVTRFGGLYEAYVLAGLGAYGFLFKNEKMKTTTLLATQSYITSAAVAYTLKFLAGRQRPSVYSTDHVEAEPTFHGPFYKGGRNQAGNRTNSSFPSGHTTAAFSAATVYAMEYKNRPWIPIMAYSAATLIGLSRMTENKHWFTDILVGATLGYLTGRQVVNNYHRYSKLKAPKKNTLTFSLDYFDRTIMPGFVYRFR